MSYSDLRKKYGLTSETESKTGSTKASQSGGYAALQKKYGISYDVDEKYLSTFLSDTNSFFGSINDLEQIEILRRNHAVSFKTFTEPLHKSVPKGAAHKDNGDHIDLAGLDHGQHLRKFIKSPETAGENDDR